MSLMSVCRLCGHRLYLGEPVVALAPGDTASGVAHLACWAALPHERATQIAREHRAARATSLEGMHVLVASNDHGTATALAVAFELWGATTATAVPAVRVRDAIRAGAPDVIVTDLCLERDEGSRLRESVRSLPVERGGRAHIVAVSAEDWRRREPPGRGAEPVEIARLVAAVVAFAGDRAEPDDRDAAPCCGRREYGEGAS